MRRYGGFSALLNSEVPREKAGRHLLCWGLCREEGWDLRIEEDHEEKRRKTSEILLEVSLETLHKVYMER